MRIFTFDATGFHEIGSGPQALHNTLANALGEPPMPPTNSLSIPLVGMHFRPPAKEVLSILPTGTPLILTPEPSNPYDPNAVSVLVDMGALPLDRVELLNAILPPNTPDASELCSRGPFHLGYLAATGAKTTRGGPGNTQALMLMSNGPVRSILGNAPEGYATVEIAPIPDITENW